MPSTFQNKADVLKKRCAAEAVAGLRATAVQGVRLFWSTIDSPLTPMLYETGILLLLGGTKQGRVGDALFRYDAGTYLVMPLPLPVECAHQASPEAPLWGLMISIDREDLAVLLAQLAEHESLLPQSDMQLIAPAPIEDSMSSVIERLIAIHDDPVAGPIIGPLLLREMLFHVLRGPRGASLAAVAAQNGDEGRLDKVIRAVRHDIARPVSVKQMARNAAMSPSAFHRAFRAKTGQSPLQYVKQLRLHKARDLIVFMGIKVGDAARRVGYESGSQFSREYKRYFGQNASEMPSSSSA